MSLNASSKSGFVLKYDPYRHMWTRLWVVVAQRELRCLLNPHDSSADSILPLREFVSYQTDEASTKSQFHFFVTTPTESWLFAAESQSDCDDWVRFVNSYGPTLEKPTQQPLSQSYLPPTSHRAAEPAPASALTMPRSRRSASIGQFTYAPSPQNSGSLLLPQQYHPLTPMATATTTTPTTPTPTVLYTQSPRRIQGLEYIRVASTDLGISGASHKTMSSAVSTPRYGETAHEQDPTKSAAAAEGTNSDEVERLKKYITELENKYVFVKKKAKEAISRVEELSDEIAIVKLKHGEETASYQKKIEGLESELDRVTSELALGGSKSRGFSLPVVWNSGNADTDGVDETNGQETSDAKLDTSEVSDSFGELSPDNEKLFGSGLDRRASAPVFRKPSDSSQRTKYTYIFKDVQLPRLDECNEHIKEIFRSLKDLETGKVGNTVGLPKLKSLSLHTKALFHRLCEEIVRYGSIQKDLEKRLSQSESKVQMLAEKNTNLHQENLSMKKDKKKGEEEKRGLQSEVHELQNQLKKIPASSGDHSTPQSARSQRKSRVSSPGSPES